MISLDTEVVGLDIRHGCKPYIVTTCDEQGDHVTWEWYVDPLTRQPIIPPEDLTELEEYITGQEIVLHNAKFDVLAISSILPHYVWDWSKTYDTIIAGHLIQSNMKRNLTEMAMAYLSRDIKPFEDEMQEATEKCRRMCRRDFKDWRIAEKGLKEMPSSASELWRADCWLPKLIARELKYEPNHRWHRLTKDYADSDSSTTIDLWLVLRDLIQKRDLMPLYHERMKLLPISYRMECNGVTLDKGRVAEIKEMFGREVSESEEVCINIAADYGYSIKMPGGASVNDSTREFCFDYLSLEKRYSKKSKGSGPTLDKDTLTHYVNTLPKNTRESFFVENWLRKRGCSKTVGDIEQYERFWLDDAIDKRIARLHPNFNITGADTLRWSCSNPNTQNISKREGYSLRYIFGPAEGREWWTCDAKNIELRIPSFEAGEELLIDVFLRPDDPPYYGSYHLAVFDVLYPDIYAKYGKKCKDLYESTLYQWVKNGNFCVPMQTEALTKEGWKGYDQLSVGDMVMGWDDGVLVWTPVLEKYKFNDAPLMMLENNHFKVTSTPNHRWLGRKRSRTRGKEPVTKTGFFTTEQMNTECQIIVSAPASTLSTNNITVDECALVGFVYSDGHIEMSEETGNTSQAHGDKVMFRARIFQSKDTGVKYLDELFSRLGNFVKKKYPGRDGYMYEIRPEYARDVWRRAGLWDTRMDLDFEKFVLTMSSKQREAYLEAIYVAEGWSDNIGTRLYSQKLGSFADSIKLAVFMSGKNPTIHDINNTYYKYVNKSGTINTPKRACVIRESKPYVTGQRVHKAIVGSGPVWCIKTSLSTWVMRQDNQITLTGNSVIYGAQRDTADKTYRFAGAYDNIQSKFPKIAELNKKMVEYANAHGYVETIPDKLVSLNRGYPLWCPEDGRGRVLPTAPLNYHVQGTAMYWTAIAMVECDKLLSEWNRDGYDGFMAIQVHDELVFDLPKRAHPLECPEDSNLYLVRELQRAMERCGDRIGVPTPTSAKYCPVHWGESVSVS